MKKLRVIFIIGILLSLSGCLIYFVSQPPSTVSGIPFKVAVTSLPAQFSIEKATATSVVGIEIPDSWSVSSVTYLWGAGGTNPISGTGIFIREESEYMNTNYATKGYVWKCYKGPELGPEYLDLGYYYGDMYFTVNVHYGASGTYTLRYCAGPGPGGSSCAVECHISQSNLNTRGYCARLAGTDPLPAYPEIVQRKIVVNGSAYYLDNWQSCSKPNEYGSLSGVAYGNGTFVAVGSYGEILTSPDGVTWTRRDSGTEKDLSGVAYGVGTFIAVGSYGEILTSPDGLAWTERCSGTSSLLKEVSYGNDTFVAVGETVFGDAIILMSKYPSTTGGGGGCFISAIE